MRTIEAFAIAQAAIQAAPRLWAYLDPGMGSMAFQVLLAGALSASFFLKSWMKQVREVMGIKTRK